VKIGGISRGTWEGWKKKWTYERRKFQPHGFLKNRELKGRKNNLGEVRKERRKIGRKRGALTRLERGL